MSLQNYGWTPEQLSLAQTLIDLADAETLMDRIGVTGHDEAALFDAIVARGYDLRYPDDVAEFQYIREICEFSATHEDTIESACDVAAFCHGVTDSSSPLLTVRTAYCNAATAWAAGLWQTWLAETDPQELLAELADEVIDDVLVWRPDADGNAQTVSTARDLCIHTTGPYVLGYDPDRADSSDSLGGCYTIRSLDSQDVYSIDYSAYIVHGDVLVGILRHFGLDLQVSDSARVAGA